MELDRASSRWRSMSFSCGSHGLGTVPRDCAYGDPGLCCASPLGMSGQGVILASHTPAAPAASLGSVVHPRWGCRVVHSRVEICLCVDLLHNLASDLPGCGHQPLAQFVEMAAFQHMWIWPEPLPPTETYAVRQVPGSVNKARTGRIPAIGFISRTGPDCLANSCKPASGKAECRASEKRDGLFRREPSHAGTGPRSCGCADQRPSGGGYRCPAWSRWLPSSPSMPRPHT